MRGDKTFFDTNVLIYAFAKNDARTDAAEALLAAGGMVGVQILNEFVAVALCKLAMPWEEILDALSALRVLFPSPVPLTIETHDAALRISARYGYHIVPRPQRAADVTSADSIRFTASIRFS